MTRSEPGCVPRGKPLDRLLLATVGLPVLAFAWGTREGQVAFVLFREPKLALLQALGWSLLAALAWVQPGGLRAADAWGRLRRPPWALLALFLTWSLITALWVEVPHNLLYELGQYALLLPLRSHSGRLGGPMDRRRLPFGRGQAMLLGGVMGPWHRSSAAVGFPEAFRDEGHMYSRRAAKSGAPRRTRPLKGCLAAPLSGDNGQA